MPTFENEFWQGPLYDATKKGGPSFEMRRKWAQAQFSQKNNGKVLNDLKTMSSVLVHQRLNMPKQQQRSSQVPTLVVKGTFFKGSTLLRPEDYYLIISSRLF